MIETTDPNGVKVVQELIERAKGGGGFVTYVMPKIEGERPAPKISYAKGVKEWQWYIGTGLYLDDIEDEVAKLHKAQVDQLWRNVLKICVTLALLWIGCYAISARMSRRTRAAFEGFLSFFRDASVASANVTAEGLEFAEFDRLAESANEMITKRREAEATLRESEQRLSILFEKATDAIYVCTLDGRFVQVNRQACDSTGFSEEELLAMNAADIAAEASSAEEVGQFFRRLRPGNPFTVESYHCRKDGSTFPVEITVGLFETPEDTFAMGIVRDITERREKEIEYSQILKTAIDGFWVVDTRGAIVEANAAAGSMLGYELEEMLGLNVSDVDAFEQADEVDERIHRLVAKGAERFTAVHRRKDGSLVDVEVSACYIASGGGRFVAFLRDVTERNRYEEALRKSKEELSRAQEIAHLGSYTWDLKTGELYWSEELKRILGAETEEPSFELFVSRIHPDDREWVIRHGHAMREKACPFELEYRILWPDGTIRHVRDKGEGLRSEDDSIAVMVGTSLDITHRKETEGRLRASEERFRMLFNNLSSGVAIYEAVDDGQDFVFVAMNAAGLEFGQLTGDEVIGNRVSDVFPYVQTVGLLDVFERVWRTGKQEDFPLIEYDDGRIRQWVENTVFKLPSGLVVAIFEDTSERRLAEEESKRLMLAIEQAAETVVITDAHAVIQYVNPTFERVAGYSREEATGQNPSILKSGEHDDAFYEDMWRALTQGETWTGRITNMSKNGTLFTEDAVISPVRDDTGKIVNYVAVKRDVTEELRLEEQIRQAQKMEAIGQLTGGVAHDFNNLLQIINVGTTMALEDIPEQHPSREVLTEVINAGERAARLVAQLLLFSRRQVMRPTCEDLNEVVEEMLKMLRRIIGEDIQIEWLPAKRPGATLVDRGMVEQVIMNLCVNARDAMPEGGRLVLETHDRVLDEAYCAYHTWAEPGRYVLLSVSDTGCGMDEGMLQQVFEPFFTTKEAGKGTGLGLATVYGIVKQHAGLIHVESAPGDGSTFSVYWPIAPSQCQEAEEDEDSEARGGMETILLVEDDDGVQRLARRLLEKAGYTVHSARNGRDGLNLFKELNGAIDLAILDVVMPEMGGREASDRMRALHPDLKVIFASGYSEDAIHKDFVLEEGLTLLQKPFLAAELLRAVRDMLDGRLRQ